MTKPVLLAAVLLATVVTSAIAQPPGVNLSWDDCNASVGEGLNKTSACLSNSEAVKSLYGSYVLPVDLESLASNDILMDISTNSATLPCWWNFATSPRTAGYAMSFTLPCSNAFNYWGTIPGGPFGVATASLMPTSASPRVRVRAAVAIESDRAQRVPASIGEIYSFTFQLTHDATVGTCTGCATSACFELRMIRPLPAYFASEIIELTTASSRHFVFWQSGARAGPGCGHTPAVNRTWGSVKALYR